MTTFSNADASFPAFTAKAFPRWFGVEGSEWEFNLDLLHTWFDSSTSLTYVSFASS